MMTLEDYMRIALEEAKKGDMPYGAILVKEDQIVIRGHNTAQRDHDVTAHAEINVLRQLILEKKSYSLDVLNGYILYTTCEPCPMCASACVWAGVSEIVFGASTQQLIQLGSPQINISCERVVEQGFQKIKITPGILAEDCLALFK